MARTETARYAFNRGLISALATARVDLKRSALSAEEMTNWMPRALGSMMLRPGRAYLGATAGNAAPRHIPFVRSLSAMYLLEFTNAALRIWLDDALLTRIAVTSAVTNGDFDANLGSWTDNDEVGGASTWAVGGYMQLLGSGSAAAIRDQQVTVIVANRNKEHALRIAIQRGPVILRVGSSSGGDEYITETTLYTGTHSLAFTPTGDFYIRFMSRLNRIVLVDSCNVEAAGVVSLPSPYATADLDYIRADVDSLSIDVLFMACVGYTQRRIERRGSGRSWSIVLYQPDDGPFRVANITPTTLTPGALSGNTTLTASSAFFKSTHAPSTNNGGALFRLVSTGQTVTTSITAQNTFTTAIRVTGVSNDRAVAITLTGLTGTGSTVTLQRSLDSSTGPWTDVSGKTWTADTAENFNDSLDNQIVWYRIGVKTGDYAGGTIIPTMTYAGGSITGVCRVTAFTSVTVVQVEVLSAFGATTATDDWAESRWSDLRGWPSAGTIYEGRMNWDGFDQVQLSVSDQFDGFDPDTEGDSGPIDRSIGSGPLETVNWALPLQRLVLGAQMGIHSVRSNTFDEPLTPTNFNRKQCASQGSAAVQACRVDSRGFFVDGGGTRVYELAFNAETYDYAAEDATKLVPEIGEPRIVRMAVQRKPDTRLHFLRSDGTAAVLVYDHTEQVLCWCELDAISYDADGEVIDTGLIKDVVVLPATSGRAEDQVYYDVQRTINGSTVVYHEKWALESECIGGTLNKQADSFITFAGPTTIVTGLGHLVGETVVVWADGKSLNDADGEIATFIVSVAGEINLTHEGVVYVATAGVVGVPYRARWKSAKLGQTLSKHKNVDHIGLILRNTHAQGIRMGSDFEHMDNLPLTYQGAPVDPDSVYEEYDEEPQPFPGTWSVDARICLEANAPRPANVMAMTIAGQVT